MKKGIIRYYVKEYESGRIVYCAVKDGENEEKIKDREGNEVVVQKCSDRRRWELNSLEETAKGVKSFYNSKLFVLVNSPLPNPEPDPIIDSESFTLRSFNESEERRLFDILGVHGRS